MKVHSEMIELTGVVDEAHRVLLDDAVVPLDSQTRVRLIVVPDDDDVSEFQWMRWLAHNPAYDFLKDEAEDIYTIADGRPIHVEG